MSINSFDWILCWSEASDYLLDPEDGQDVAEVEHPKVLSFNFSIRTQVEVSVLSHACILTREMSLL